MTYSSRMLVEERLNRDPRMKLFFTWQNVVNLVLLWCHPRTIMKLHHIALGQPIVEITVNYTWSGYCFRSVFLCLINIIRCSKFCHSVCGCVGGKVWLS
jgi:hypothetical protein